MYMHSSVHVPLYSYSVKPREGAFKKSGTKSSLLVLSETFGRQGDTSKHRDPNGEGSRRTLSSIQISQSSSFRFSFGVSSGTVANWHARASFCAYYQETYTFMARSIGFGTLQS